MSKLGVPYAATEFDTKGAFVICPICKTKIRLARKKDEESFSTLPYAKHVESKHPKS